MHSPFRCPDFLVATLFGIPLSGIAETGTDHFESKIRPVLAEHCYECHSVESGKSKGGLLLDTREAIRKGGDTGPAVVPGDTDASLLLVAMRHEDPDLEMPPRKPKLSDMVARDFEQWIEEGAPDPRDGGGTGDDADFESRRKHWSFLSPARTTPPFVSDEAWPESPIDRFVLAELEAHELSPSPDASNAFFVRRLCFDLTGLPPTPEQIAAFSDSTLREFVDELLASPAFGVRWGRHWLDVARFAESNGKEANIVYPHAWRYRDYVIDAFARDLPYDRFLVEQIAGDLLPADDPGERARLLIATGFLALGPKGLSEGNDLVFEADIADEQIDAVGRSMLALSLACARCHDHKADAVTIEDYYALAGIFQSTDTRFGTWVDSENQQGGKLVRLPDEADPLVIHPSISEEEVQKLNDKLTQLAADEKAGSEKQMADLTDDDRQAMFNDALREALRIIWTRGPVVGKLEIHDETGRALPVCMGVIDEENPVDSPLYERGDMTQPREEIERAVPPIFGIPEEGPVPDDVSGRLELARWITSKENPLTARVFVNRAWRQLFGAGLVATTDDFGRTGEDPSHPELLDHLALSFMEDGWSVKSLVRSLVLSRSYRQDSAFRADAFSADPDNRLLWRMPKRRLEAEAIRDAMLAVSGELDSSPRRGSLAAELNTASVSLVAFNDNLPGDLDGSLRRSVYLPVFRDHLPDVLALFDFAEPSLVTGNRDTTNVPPQALYLMNSDFVRERANALADRVSSEADAAENRIDRAFQLCFGRGPDETERKLALDYLSGENADGSASRLALFCQTLLASAEFRITD